MSPLLTPKVKKRKLRVNLESSEWLRRIWKSDSMKRNGKFWKQDSTWVSLTWKSPRPGRVAWIFRGHGHLAQRISLYRKDCSSKTTKVRRMNDQLQKQFFLYQRTTKQNGESELIINGRQYEDFATVCYDWRNGARSCVILHHEKKESYRPR